MTQKVLIVFSEKHGECEGAFDEHGNLLDFWSCNDASWRNEYFSPFLKKLGIETQESDSPSLRKKLEKAVKKAWA